MFKKDEFFHRVIRGKQPSLKFGCERFYGDWMPAYYGKMVFIVVEHWDKLKCYTADKKEFIGYAEVLKCKKP